MNQPTPKSSVNTRSPDKPATLNNLTGITRAALKTVVKLEKERDRLDKEEKRLRNEYPCGTCNAEDAWSDHFDEVAENRKQLRKAINAIKRISKGREK